MPDDSGTSCRSFRTDRPAADAAHFCGQQHRQCHAPDLWLLVVILACSALWGPCLQSRSSSCSSATILDPVEPTRIIIAAYAILGIESVYANHVLGVGDPKNLVHLWIPPFLLSFVLNVALIPRLGLVGAALSMLATNGLLFVLVLRFVARKMHVPVRDFLIVRPGDMQAWLGVLRRLRSTPAGGPPTKGVSDDA